MNNINLFLLFGTIIIAYYVHIPSWISLILLLFFYILPVYTFHPLLKKMFGSSIIFRNDKCISNSVALTIDDVPTESFGQILTTLGMVRRSKYKATFFVISDYVNNHPVYRRQLIRAIRDGHELSNHGKTNTMHALLNHDQLENEIIDCDRLIEALYKEAGRDRPSIKFYRPGCGLVTPSMVKLCKKLNYYIALGSVYPQDPIVPFPIWNFCYIILKMMSGDIIILHDRKWT